MTVTYITAIKVGSPPAVERITSVKWLQCGTGKAGESTVPAMVEFMDQGNRVFVGGVEGHVEVEVVRPEGRQPYLRTRGNGTRTDNLLSLPRF